MNLQKAPKREKKRSPDHDGEDGYSGSETQKDSPSIPPNSGHRKVTREDIKYVQNLIEGCLKLYKTKDEVVDMLVNHVRFGKHFIDIVWQRLEEENPDFFRNYNNRLKLRDQIITFNQLLKEQQRLTNWKGPYWPNGLNHKPVNSSQQPYHPPIGSTDMESLCYGSSCHMVDGVAAEGNSNFIPQKREAAIDNHKMNIESFNQASYEQHAFQRSIGHSMASGASFLSDIYNMEGFQPALDGGVGISTNNIVSHHDLLTNFIDRDNPFQSNQSSLFQDSDILDDMSGSSDDYGIAEYLIAGEEPFSEPHCQY